MRTTAVWNAAALAVMLFPVGESVAVAGSVKLWGMADGSTTYIEEPSDGFIRVDLYDPPPREMQQRFHSITDPELSYGSPTYDGFPNDEHFRMGTVHYDESGVVGGNGVAPITDFDLGVAHNPDDSAYHNYYRWLPTDTVVETFSGTVTLSGGVVTSIDLESTIRLEAYVSTVNPVIAPGWFNIEGDRFEGVMELVLGGPSSRVAWELSGTLFSLGACVPGDYLCDGAAGAEDYDFWRERFGSRDPAPDGSGNVQVDAADYVIWRMHADGAGTSASAPEPASCWLLIVAVSSAVTSARRSRQYAADRS